MGKKKSSPPKPEAEVLDAADPLALATVVSDHVRILDVRVVELKAAMTAKVGSDDTSGTLRGEHRIEEVAYEVDRGRDLIVVSPRFSFRAHDSEADDPGPLLEIDCRFGLEYGAPGAGDFEAANLEAFANTNGVFNAWPYWRELVQNTAARMGVPGIVLPVFRLGGSEKPSAPVAGGTKSRPKRR